MTPPCDLFPPVARIGRRGSVHPEEFRSDDRDDSAEAIALTQLHQGRQVGAGDHALLHGDGDCQCQQHDKDNGQQQQGNDYFFHSLILKISRDFYKTAALKYCPAGFGMLT